ncbi:MAG: DUF4912 domain-containing protein [Alicyclobacillus herbarius]|uniref:DUF4912 domain-containing protein n=1 Tax=Alicyclobacillus herbarius TaxID=122960 RepID=UPI00235696CE|nr:DUF4912 domain-containing protein [Alicyclobacillus herbarius]MCL6633324.1 DUF4912 domain-containing protein [Alicyclobacillus herbarius]
MKANNWDETMWLEIARRIEAGEKQTQIARELGIKISAFRYRLRKFVNENVDSRDVDSRKEAVATNSLLDVAELPTEGTVHNQQEAQPDEVLDLNLRTKVTADVKDRNFFDERLFDDTWTRRWSVSRLVLLVKDPATVFAYWEVEEYKRQMVSRHFHTDWTRLPLYLRLYDVTEIDFQGDNAPDIRWIPVHPDADNWYVHGVRPGRSYLMDLGTMTSNGNFFTILRSNVVQTPPDRSYRGWYESVSFVPLARTNTHERQQVHIESHASVEQDLPPETANRPYPTEFDGYSVCRGVLPE